MLLDLKSIFYKLFTRGCQMQKYTLTDTLLTFLDENNNLFIQLPNEENLVLEDVEMSSKLLELFINPISKTEVTERMYDMKYDLEDSIDGIISLLLDSNVIKPYYEFSEFKGLLSDHDRIKYARQIAHFSSQKHNDQMSAINYQKKIIDSKVLIIGVGGIGSYLSSGLAAIGVGNLTLVDFDNIELSNTSRQILYQEEDLGKEKLVVAKEKLLKINPQAEINTVNMEITSTEDLFLLDQFDFDIILLCADKPIGAIQYFVDEYSQNRGIPLLGGPFAQGKIFLGPFMLPGKTKSYSEMVPKPNFDNINESLKRINQRSVSAIIDTDNAIGAKMMEVEAIKYLTKEYSTVASKQIVVDTGDWSIEEITL